MSDRITDLEIQLTHQQRQTGRAERVGLQPAADRSICSTAELRQIKEQLQIVLPSLTKEPEDETPPPHY